MTDLRAALAGALTPAMRARDRVVVSALRSALAALANAEAQPVDHLPPAGALEGARIGAGAADAPRRELSEEDVRRIVGVEVTERERAADELAGHGRTEDADRLRAEAEVLQGFLDG